MAELKIITMEDISHNPAGKRFGQTETPPERKPEKAVEDEPKQ